jgi:hypothetical protein
MGELGRCMSMHVIEFAERGTCMAPVCLVLSHLAKENEARPLQGLGDPGGIDDTAKGSVLVHHGDARGVPLWESGVLLLRRWALERRVLGAR